MLLRPAMKRLFRLKAKNGLIIIKTYFPQHVVLNICGYMFLLVYTTDRIFKGTSKTRCSSAQVFLEDKNNGEYSLHHYFFFPYNNI